MSKLIPRKVIRGVIYKRCGRCLEYKPTSDFHPHRTRKPDFLQSYCKECELENNKKYRQSKKGQM